MLNMVSIEIILMLVSLGVTVGVWMYVWRRPAVVENTFQAQINLLRADLETTRRELNIERQESRANRTALEAVLKRNYQLYNEVQRMNEVVLWMRRQLADRNIELPPLPRELSESRLDTPGVAIRIDQSGVSINDSTVHASDIIGGDESIGGNQAR
jgi:hypothetical protein